jgi:hypothetical protein
MAFAVFAISLHIFALAMAGCVNFRESQQLSHVVHVGDPSLLYC